MFRSARFVFALVFALSSTLAYGDGDRTIPGAACKEQYNSSTYIDTYGRQYNTASSSKNWICTIERECTLDETDSAWMYVIDRHYSSDITCTLYMRTYSGSSADYETESSDGSSTSAQKLSYGEIDNSNYGYLYFYCSIPGYYSSSSNRSGVVSYYNTEGC